MTKKDYELIAKQLKAWYAVYNVSDIHWYGLVNGFADRLNDANEAFDRDKFLTACGVK